jgi:transketolase
MTQALNPLQIQSKLAATPKAEPKFQVKIKNKSGAEITLADPKATRALVALMNQHAVIGGAAAHWGGPAAFAEMMSAIHALMFANTSRPWFEQFHFVNDAGHTENGIYAVRANYGFDQMSFDDLRGFRSIESKLTGHGEAHLNPEGVLISNGPLGSGVPQAQGLCFADRLTGNDRVTLCALSDGGAMEGETKEALAAIPGLASKGKMNPFVLMISDNNTKLSGRIETDSYSMTPTFKTLEVLGFEVLWVDQGHDLEIVYQSLEAAIERAQKNNLKPQAIVFRTIKGYGVKSTAESASGGHGYPLKPYDEKLIAFIQEIYSDQAPAYFIDWAQDILKSKPEAKKSSDAIPRDKVQAGIAKAAIKKAQDGLPVFSVTSDLQGSTGIAGFHKAFPDRVLDVGVAESNMISTAIGLSKMGYIPIVDTFAQFAITKGNLPLIMSGLSEAPVIGLFSHTGFQDAADGASHQATTYFAATSSIPYTEVISLSCEQAAFDLLGQGLELFAKDRVAGKPVSSQLYFFGRETHPLSYVEGVKYQWGKATVLNEGDAGVIVATGPMVEVALKACVELKKSNINLCVVDAAFINNPDTQTITQLLKKCDNKLITIEDHQVKGGMGAQLVHALAQVGVTPKVKSLGIPGIYGQSAYLASQLYDRYNLSVKGITEAYQNL